MRGSGNLKSGFMNFLKQEPVYLWLILFIVFINIMPHLLKMDEDADTAAEAQKPSKAKILIEKRHEIEKAITEDKRMSSIAGSVMMAAAVSIFTGLILNFIILIRRTNKIELLKRTCDLPQARWSVWDAVKVAILFLTIGYTISIAAALILPRLPASRPGDNIISIANATIMDLVGIGIVFYFAAVRYKHKIKDLGLTFKNFAKNLSYGFLGYLAILPTLFITLVLTAAFLNFINREPAPQPIFNIFLEEKSAPALVYLSIFVAVLGPVMEEIFFRGFLYTAIKREMDTKGAILISGLLFSCLHAHLAGFLPILILGIFLAYLYEKTGSLVPSITVHVSHNLVMVFLMFLVKGIKF